MVREKLEARRSFCRASGEALGKLGSFATTIGAAVLVIGYIFALSVNRYDSKINKLNKGTDRC